MTITPCVSVVLPARNAQATLARAIDSILQQTFRNFELIVIDDHSRDETRDIIEEYGKKDDRVRRIHAERGLIPALRAGCEAATGRYIARMDADDLAMPERFKQQVRFLDDNRRIDVCSCLVEITGNETNPDGLPREGFARYERWLNNLMSPEEIAVSRFIESPVAHPTVMMRRMSYERAGGYRDTGWAEDHDLWLRMMNEGMRFAKVPEVLLHWQDGPSRLTRTDFRYSEENFLRCKAHHLARLAAVGERGAIIAAAGPTGKALARFLKKEGITIHGFIDVHPRRVGEEIGGVPVHDINAISEPSPEAPVQLAAAGSPDAREKIALLFTERGFVPGIDFWAVA